MSAATSIPHRERILGGLWGSLVGDALGVPVEFKDRAKLQADPVTDLREFGAHNQPRGAWSDDGSLILCTADSLLNHEIDLADMGGRFVRWKNDGLWTSHGDAFDIGLTTSTALLRIAKGTPVMQAGERSEDGNGNGSLMRMLPVTLRFAMEPIEAFAGRVESASAITHGHARSQMACVFHGLMTRRLSYGQSPEVALASARAEFSGWYERAPEFAKFRHIIEDNLATLPEEEIASSGYVLHTLLASLWCLLTTQNFRDCVLKAVNLGGDTDTTGCVAGGLAGVAYGIKSIPPGWISQLARKDDVDCLFQGFAGMCEPAAPKIPV
jgi:ADP-ribosylglycohydrolase